MKLKKPFCYECQEEINEAPLLHHTRLHSKIEQVEFPNFNWNTNELKEDEVLHIPYRNSKTNELEVMEVSKIPIELPEDSNDQ